MGDPKFNSIMPTTPTTPTAPTHLTLNRAYPKIREHIIPDPDGQASITWTRKSEKYLRCKSHL